MMMEVLTPALWLPLLLLSGAGTAEAHGGGSASSTGPAWAATTRAVMVGANGRVFSPNRTVASVGDVVEFSFYPGNHSVVRSAYMFPCVPFETTGAGKTGFWSGFFDDKSQTPGRWRLTITDTTPIFFYSSGPDDCNRYGMVGGINVDPGELQMQHDMAVDSPTVVQPTVASSPNGGPSGPGTPASSEPSPPPSASSGVTPGAIAGIAVGAAAALALLGFILYACGRQRGDYDQRRRMLFPLGRMGGGNGGGGGRTPSPPPSPNKESQHHRGSSSHRRNNRDGSSSNHHHQRHQQHQHHHHDERTSSMTFLPARGGTISGTHGGRDGGSGGGGGGTTASRAGTRSSVVSSTNTTSPFVASASPAAAGGGGVSSANNNTAGGNGVTQQQQSPPPPPPTAVVAAGAPIVDGDTVYVPVKRSVIVSGEFGGGGAGGSGSCCSAAASPPASPLSAIVPLPLAVPSTATFFPVHQQHNHRQHHHHHHHHHNHHNDLYPSPSPGPSPVPTAAQLHHRRWMVASSSHSQGDNSDAESGVFGFGMSRLATPRPSRGGPAGDGLHVLLSGVDEASPSRAAPPPLSLPASPKDKDAGGGTNDDGNDGNCGGGGGGGGAATAATAATSKATAELGSMLNGTAPSLFPYNNDRCVLEARGGAVATSLPAGGGGGGGGPSELSG